MEKILTIVGLIIFFPFLSFAAPFLECDPLVVDEIIINVNGGPDINSAIQTLSDGSKILHYDMSWLTRRINDVVVRSEKDGNYSESIYLKVYRDCSKNNCLFKIIYELDVDRWVVDFMVIKYSKKRRDSTLEMVFSGRMVVSKSEIKESPIDEYVDGIINQIPYWIEK
ncbi:hypothetical protein KKE60_07340 [Patescibacteria group bacterium]|nr:hypothetical protein [Patescibacteria group bacterium]